MFIYQRVKEPADDFHNRTLGDIFRPYQLDKSSWNVRILPPAGFILSKSYTTTIERNLIPVLLKNI
jgi:hypothetical protein